MRAGAEEQAFRCSIQVESEDGPEYSVSPNKALAVALKIKPLGPRFLICRKTRQEAIDLRRGLVQVCSPDMYFVPT
jgi:hypothetical protein